MRTGNFLSLLFFPFLLSAEETEELEGIMNDDHIEHFHLIIFSSVDCISSFVMLASDSRICRCT